MVENLAVQLGLGSIIGLKRGQSRGVSLVPIAHSDGHFAQLGGIAGQQMSLQVEHDLQPMLDLAQKGVVLVENRALLMRQATTLLEARDRLEGIAGAQRRQISAVEKLEKLNHE